MLRNRIVHHMSMEFGPPQAGNGYERWVIHTNARRTSLHVVVNAPLRPDLAQVLIFDPAKINGDAAIDVQVTNSGEIVQLMARIKRLSLGLPRASS